MAIFYYGFLPPTFYHGAWQHIVKLELIKKHVLSLTKEINKKKKSLLKVLSFLSFLNV